MYSVNTIQTQSAHETAFLREQIVKDVPIIKQELDKQKEENKILQAARSSLSNQNNVLKKTGSKPEDYQNRLKFGAVVSEIKNIRLINKNKSLKEDKAVLLGKVDTLETEGGKKDRDIEDWKAVCRRQEEIYQRSEEQYRRKLEEKERKIEKKKAKIQQKDEAIRQKDEAIHQKDEAIQSREIAIQEKLDSLRQKDDAIQSREIAIQEKLDSLRQKDETIQRLNDQVARIEEKHEKILKDTIEDHKKTLKDTIEDHKKALKDLETKADEIIKEIALKANKAKIKAEVEARMAQAFQSSLKEEEAKGTELKREKDLATAKIEVQNRELDSLKKRLAEIEAPRSDELIAQKQQQLKSEMLVSVQRLRESNPRVRQIQRIRENNQREHEARAEQLSNPQPLPRVAVTGSQTPQILQQTQTSQCRAWRKIIKLMRCAGIAPLAGAGAAGSSNSSSRDDD